MAAARKRAAAKSAAPAAGPWVKYGSGETAQAAPEPYGESYAGQAVSGVNEGIANTLGAPVQLVNDLVVKPVIAGVNTVAGTEFQASDKPFLGQQHMREIMAPTIAAETDDPTKQMVRRVGEEFGAAAVPVAGMASKAARPISMLATEAGLTAGSGAGAAVAEQVAPDNPWAELAGQVVGALGAGGVARTAKKAITPNPASSERVAAAETLKREGVDLTAGQKTGSKGLQYAEAELGGSSAGAFTEKQAEQFTTAALKRAGIKADRATPEVIDGAFKRIGSEFDDLAASNTLTLDRQMGTDLGDVWREYIELVPDSQQAPVVGNLIQDLVAKAQATGTLDGKAYQTIRSRLDRMARKAQSDPQLADALFGIRNAVDDAMERSMTPEDVARWSQARREYRNMFVIEKAASAAGENAALGLISPAQLRQAAAAQSRRAYARGQGDFDSLARAGVATMTPLPQSGTAPRAAVQAAKAAAPAVGAVLGSGAGPGIGTVVGGLAGAAVPAVAGKAILSAPGRAYLGNQLARNIPSTDPRGIGPLVGVMSGNSLSGPDERRRLNYLAASR